MDFLSELEAEYWTVKKSKNAAELRVMIVAAAVALGAVLLVFWLGVDHDKPHQDPYLYYAVTAFCGLIMLGACMSRILLTLSIVAMSFGIKYFTGTSFRKLKDHELENLASALSIGSVDRPATLSEEQVGEIVAVIKSSGAISLEQLAESLRWGMWVEESPDLSAPGTQAILKLAHEKH